LALLSRNVSSGLDNQKNADIPELTWTKSELDLYETHTCTLDSEE